VLLIGIVLMPILIRIRLSILNFDVDPDPDPTPSFTRVGRSDQKKKNLISFTAVPVFVLPVLSAS
jgi:hypothetical protein